MKRKVGKRNFSYRGVCAEFLINLHRQGLQRRQKKLQLSWSLCGVLCLPCVRDLQVCEARLQASPRRGQWRTKCAGVGFASVRSTFAGVAETGVGEVRKGSRKALSPDSVVSSPTGRALTLPGISHPSPYVACAPQGKQKPFASPRSPQAQPARTQHNNSAQSTPLPSLPS